MKWWMGRQPTCLQISTYISRGSHLLKHVELSNLAVQYMVLHVIRLAGCSLAYTLFCFSSFP